MKELLKKVRRLEIKTRRMVDNTFAGEYHSAFKGQGLEFDEVRLYQFGDDIRSIDWNVTAKTGQVHIKKFREEREQTMFVLFDVSGSEDFGHGSGNKLQIGTEIAAILAFSAMKNNDKIGVLTFSDQVETFFAPKKGRKHILAIIRGLLQSHSRSRLTSLKTAIEFVRKTLRRRSIVILISDFLDEGYEKALTQLSQRHEVILIRLFNPDEVMHRGLGTIPVRDIETGRMLWLNAGDGGSHKQIWQRFEDIYENLDKLCKKTKMDLVQINTNTDYFVELERFFRKRNARKKRG